VELTPGLNVTSDADIGTHLRAMFNSTLAHTAGTAAMPSEEHGGVVGPDLKVYGVGKLSVIDASVIPYLPTTHLCTTVYAIAKKAAFLIKEKTAWTE
jgi:choline dehydrogenase-like flavoprotein